MQISSRPRRNRSSRGIRDLIAETTLDTSDLIAPLFFLEGKNQVVPIESMPGQNRYSVDELVKKVRDLSSLGINCVSLFPVVADGLKSKTARESYNSDGLNQIAVAEVKNACPDMIVMTDIALDPYSSDGHDGLVSDSGEVLNDETLEILAKMALAQAKAGSDILGPSDMMDGRVGYIRQALEENNFSNVSIMSYTAKYASSFYGPFRDALDSAPKAGDKKSYQMDYRNSEEALRELYLDESEGADIVMIKPGISYLDIIQKLKLNTNLPVAAYNVSGEYSMVKAASQKGWIDGEAVMIEMLTSFKRAGADMILTYFAEEMARLKS